MPQLDQVTFFSQFFWLSIFYIGFYIVILKNFLPKLSRILKFRKKKISFSQQGVATVEEEKNKISGSLDALVERGVNTSETVFQTNLKAINFWLNNIILETNKTEWKDSNQSYISSLGEKSLSQNLALYLTLINIPEKIFISLLIDKIKSFRATSI